MKKLIAIVSLAALAACAQVDDGNVGLKKIRGQVQSETVQGMVYINPITTDVVEMNVRQQKVENKGDTSSFDLQQVNYASMTTVHLMPSKAVAMYKTVGPEWIDLLVPRVVTSVEKNELGKVRATDIISRRSVVEASIRNGIARQLHAKGVALDDYQLTDASFSKGFMQAVEAKEIAVQTAVAEKNKTAAIQERATQAVITAKGNAEALKVTSQGLEANPKLIEYEALKVQSEAIRKWDGVLPTQMLGGGAMPFINVTK